MHTKIYQLLYIFTFSVEYLSRLTLNHKITKSCGTFCRIDGANVSNLILIIRHYVTIWNICVYHGSALTWIRWGGKWVHLI